VNHLNQENAAYLPLKFDKSSIFPQKILSIRPDVHLTVSAGTLQSQTERNSGTTAPVFELSYTRRSVLCGEVERTPVELRPGYSTLGFLGQAAGHCEYENGAEVLLYSVWVGPDAFDRFCEAVCGSPGAGFGSFQSGSYCCRSYPSDAREEHILHRLDACFSGEAAPCNRLLLESSLLELLSINLERLLRPGCPACGAKTLTRTDRALF
jgi:hypothetical protein